MGVLALGKCFGSPLEAAFYVCQTSYPVSSVLANGDTLFVRCTSVPFNTSGSIVLNRTLYPLAGGSSSTSITPVVATASCDSESQSDTALFDAQAADLFELWGLLLGSLALIWAGKSVYGLFNSYRGES